MWRLPLASSTLLIAVTAISPEWPARPAPAAAAELPPLPTLSSQQETMPPVLPGDAWLPSAWPAGRALMGPLGAGRVIVAGDGSPALRWGREQIALGRALQGEALLEELSLVAWSPSERGAAALALGESLLRRGEARAAAVAFQRAGQELGDDPAAWPVGFWEGAALARAGESRMAAGVLGSSAESVRVKAALAGPQAAQARRARLLALRWAGWLEAEAGEFPAARSLWRSARAEARADAALIDSLTLDLAETFFAEAAWDSVADLLGRPAHPASAGVRWNLLHGRACFELRDWGRADSLLAEVSDEGAGAPQAWIDEGLMVRAWIALKRGETARALELYDRVSGDRVTDLPLAQYGAALAHLQEKRFTEAEALLAPAAPVARGDALHDAWAYALAFTRFQQERYGEVLSDLEGLGGSGAPEGTTAADSLTQGIWMLRGDASYRLGDLEAAATAYARAAAFAPEESEGLLRRQALVALALERWGGAARIFGDLLIKFPGTPQASEYHFWRGEAFYRLGRLEEARRQYARAEQMGADPLQCAYAGAWCFFGQDRFDDSLAQYTRAALLCNRCPLASDIALRRGNCLFRLGRVGEAARAYAEAQHLAGGGDDAAGSGRDAAFRSAWALLRLEDYAAAREQFARIHREGPADPLSARALFWEGQAAFRAGEFAAAIDRFTSLVEHPAADDTLRARGLLAGGDAAFNQGETATAIDWYRRVLESPGADPAIRRSAHESLFESRQLRGEHDEARLELQELEQHHPEALAGGERYLQLAEGFYRSGRYQDALQLYGDFLEHARPDDARLADARYHMARSREELGQWREAAAAFAALGETPDFRYASESLLRAGVLLLKGREARSALRVLDRRLTLELSPADAALTRAHIARAYEELGEKTAAKNEWEQVAHAGAEVPDSLRALGSLHLGRSAFESGMWEAALQAFDAADGLGLPRRIHRAPYWAGESAFRMGSFGVAVRWLEEFLSAGEREPLWEATARMRLAECYEKLGRWDEAQAQYEHVVGMPLEMQSLLEEARARLAALREGRTKRPGSSPSGQGGGEG
ncbi:MAG: tetratricopeptide repeat protein [Candidatus Eisenbacteria bacterium]